VYDVVPESPGYLKLVNLNFLRITVILRNKKKKKLSKMARKILPLIINISTKNKKIIVVTSISRFKRSTINIKIYGVSLVFFIYIPF